MLTPRLITVRQPWAWAIVAGIKLIDTRDTYTDQRGPVLVASHSTDTDTDGITRLQRHGFSPPDELPRGVIVGLVDLVECLAADSVHLPTLEYRRFAGDPLGGGYHWLFANPRLATNLTVRAQAGGIIGRAPAHWSRAFIGTDLHAAC